KYTTDAIVYLNGDLSVKSIWIFVHMEALRWGTNARDQIFKNFIRGKSICTANWKKIPRIFIKVHWLFLSNDTIESSEILWRGRSEDDLSSPIGAPS
ncbi:hypothetical protein HAX54_008874, partial [Datura stramonium]|nr:hypothetical protein [Datura stramonium]